MLLVLVRHVKTGGLHVKNDYHSVEWIITHMNKQGFSTAQKQETCCWLIIRSLNQVKLGIKVYFYINNYYTIEQYFNSNIIQPKITK